MENKENLTATETTKEQSGVISLDDFFASFESNLAAPVIFKKPEEGEACEACSG